MRNLIENNMDLRLRVTALAWMHRAKLLEGGSELEKLSRKELQELVNALEVIFFFCFSSIQLNSF